jgi:hypothetical protein
MAKSGCFHAVITDSGVPLPATITIYQVGTATKATIYSTPGGAAKDNPFNTDGLGRFSFFADTGTYDIQISGTGITTYKIESVTLIADPPTFAGITLNGKVISSIAITEYANMTLPKAWDLGITIAPSLAPGALTFYTGLSCSLAVPAANAFNIASLIGYKFYAKLEGSGAIEDYTGIISQVDNYTTVLATMLKCGWFNINNRKDSSATTMYVIQTDFVNYGVASTARALYARASNKYSASMANTPSLTNSYAIYGLTENYSATGGNPATIGTAYGFKYDVTNTSALATITNNYGIYLTKPVNTGTITNHYALYIPDQTGVGATINWAVYIGGGGIYLTNPLWVANLPIYANNAAAVSGGLTAGRFYRTGADPDPVCVVH